MMKHFSAAILVAGLALAGCAATPAGTASGATATASPSNTGGRSCFWANQVNSWSASDDEKTAYLKVGVNDVYKAELFGRCQDLDTAQTIGLQSRGGGANICDGLDVVLIVESALGPQRCMVTKLNKLTPEEIAALPAKLKP